MSEPARQPHPILYDRDFFAWSEEQARLLKTRSAGGLDWENLAEELESLGAREKNEIWSRLRVLLVHLLKWEFQPERRGHSWQTTIDEQRVHISGMLAASPSLHSYPAGIFDRIYSLARKTTSRQTGLPLTAFPARPPFSIEQALDEDFMPGRPWSPEELRRD